MQKMEKEKSKNTTAKRVNRNNKKGTKNVIIFIIIVLLVILLLFLIQRNNSKNNVNEGNNQNENSYIQEIEPGVKINNSTKLNEAKDVDGLLVTNIQLTTESGMTTLLADVTNNTGTVTNVQTVDITLIDYNGNELTTVTGIIDALEVGATTQLNIAMTSDYINAYDFRITLK